MLKIGHRGAKGYVAENTLASFQKALELDVDIIELDVHVSKDNIPVVIHDETVDRTTNAKGKVTNFTAKELQNLGIPILEEVFDLVENRCGINIEIKDFEATKAVLNLINHYSFDTEKIIISSFDWNVLQLCHTEKPAIHLGVLTENSIDKALSFAKKISAYSIHPYFKLLNTENVQLMHQNGFKIYPWTVNNLEDITFVKSFLVDGIITDFPDRL